MKNLLNRMLELQHSIEEHENEAKSWMDEYSPYKEDERIFKKYADKARALAEKEKDQFKKLTEELWKKC